MFENPTDWLLRQMDTASAHYEYQRDGRLVASVTFRGDAPLVRQLLARISEESEAGMAERRAHVAPLQVRTEG